MKGPKFCELIIILLTILTYCPGCFGQKSDRSEYWVRPNISVSCTHEMFGDNCITLSDIVANSTAYLTSNTIIHFLPGVHTPNQSGWVFTEQNVSNLTLIGETGCENVNDPNACVVKIKCKVNHTIGMAFINVSYLRLSNIQTTRCGYDVPKLVKQARFQALSSIINIRDPKPKNTTMYSTIIVVSTTDPFMENVHTSLSDGFGFIAVDVVGNSTLTGCSFQESNQYLHTTSTASGGNAVFLFNNQLGSARVVIRWSIFAGLRLRPKSSVSKCDPLLTSKTLGCRQYGGLSIMINDASFPIYVHLKNCSLYGNNAHMGGGNLFAQTVETVSTDVEAKRTLIVENCTVYNGNSRFFGGGGIYYKVDISVKQYTDHLASKYKFNVINSRIYNNTSQSSRYRDGGGAIFMKLKVDISMTSRRIFKAIVLINVKINNCTLTENRAMTNGGGLFIDVNHFSDPLEIQYQFLRAIIVLTGNKILYNTANDLGGGIYIKTNINRNNLIFERALVSLFLESHTLSGNIARIGSALYMISLNSHDQLAAVIDKSIFSKNMEITPFEGNTVYSENVSRLIIYNSSFIDNNCNALYLNMSHAYFRGDIWFIRNRARNGAAVYLDCQLNQGLTSMIYFLLSPSERRTVYIVNNRAEQYGGGFRINEKCNSQKLCFFQFRTLNRETNILLHGANLEHPAVVMRNNNAVLAGNSIFGGNLEQCNLEHMNKLKISQFWSIFDIDNRNSPSPVASQAYKVCICSKDFRYGFSCPNVISISVYPGEEFHVPVVGVGQLNYSSFSNTVIGASIYEDEAQLDKVYTTQDIGIECTNLTYSLKTQRRGIELMLDIILPLWLDRKTQPAFVDISFRNCPFGFEMSEEEVCDCATNIRDIEGISCNITGASIHRPGAMWIGALNGELVVHQNCPFDYCTDEDIELTLSSQEEQCNYGREGVLCGACQHGLSLMLGASECSKCSNYYLFLIVLFGALGILLVILLLICNLTVSTGTMNGLIFYANVIQINQHIFFPPQTIYVAQLFIAWLNLDVGVKVCFADGLNIYVRTWLQFVFPIYIWLIVGLLILVSRYSIRISKLTGTNTVSVLATLFVLSYAKLLRTTFQTFYSTSLKNRNGSTTILWQIDGNYTFLEWHHALLFSAGIIVLLTHILPFTFLLLFAPNLQKMTNYRILHWVVKLKPLLDAYQGPYKEKYRFWIGFMLLVRLFLFSVFAANVQGKPQISLLVTVLTLLVLLITMIKTNGVYKSRLPNLLELFFYVNLKVYSIASMYLLFDQDNLRRNQIILSYLMTGSAFGVFLFIMGYHCYKKLIEFGIDFKIPDKMKLWSRENAPKDAETSQQTLATLTQPTVSYIELREPLIEN